MKIAITGGAGALGQGVAAAFAGETILIAARDADDKDRYAGPGEATVVDLRDLASVIAWADATGPVDALVCCAGGFAMQPITTFEAKDFDFLIDINLRTAANAIRAFAPKMPRGGAIVLVGTQTWRGTKGAGLYAAAKAGVVSLAKSASLDLKPAGVRVNVILPDMIDTPMNRAGMPGANFDSWAKPAEIGAVIHWLCSPAAAIVTGTAIEVGR